MKHGAGEMTETQSHRFLKQLKRDDMLNKLQGCYGRASRRRSIAPLWVPLSGITGVDAKAVYAENTRVTRAETAGVK